MNQYLSKGALIGIEGRIQTRSYDNQQGQKVYVTEVICDSMAFLESRRSVEEQNQQSQQNIFKVHPIFGVIQAGVYREGWRLDVRIMDV